MGVNGSATIQCALSAAGALSNCVGISETPAGQDFLAAALKMASRGAIAAIPATVDGIPAAADVVIVEVPFKLPR